MNRLVIVDDHPLMHEGQVRALDSEMDLNVVGQYESAEDLLEEIGAKTVGSYRRRIEDTLNLEGGSELTRQAVQWVESE